MNPPYVIYLNPAYVMVHRATCRHVKNRRPDNKQYVKLYLLETPKKTLQRKPVCYCKVCDPKEINENV